MERVRAVSLSKYVEVTRFLGLDPHKLMQRAGIAPELLIDPQTWLSARAASNLLEWTAAESGRSDLAILMAETRSFSSLGPVSLLLQYESTLGSIIASFQKFRRQISDLFGLSLQIDDELSILHVTEPPGFSSRQVVTLTVALTYLFLTRAMNGTWLPERVHLPFAKPKDTGSYDRFFDCDVEFSSQFSGMSFKTVDLEKPNPSWNHEMAASASALLQLTPRPPDSTSERVLSALGLLLPMGRTSLADVAGNLGVHERSLQRLLMREGRTFGDLLDEARRQLASKYLLTPAHSISQVSQLVGFAGQSTFTRWFVVQFGTTPCQWRRAAIGTKKA